MHIFAVPLPIFLAFWSVVILLTVRKWRARWVETRIRHGTLREELKSWIMRSTTVPLPG